MDCNKEDAIKAQQVAESKIVSGDYLGAKKFILKAQRLFPNLGGLPQLLAVVDVHSSTSEVTDHLAANWHQILQVDRCADEETVRKQYRKLLLLLHPDKNKYAGAASAFKLVKDAWEVFEREKDLAKLFTKDGMSQPSSRPTFFWTICPECKTLSEHANSVEQQYVQCLHCLWPFLAVKIPHNEEPSQSKCQDESVDVEKQNWYGKRAAPSTPTHGGKQHPDEKRKRSTPAKTIGRSLRSKKNVAVHLEPEPELRNKSPIPEGDDDFMSYGVKENGYMHDAEVKNDNGDCSHHQYDDIEAGMDTTEGMKNQLFEKVKLQIFKEFNEDKFQVVEIKQDDANAAQDKETKVGGNSGANAGKVIELKLAMTFMLRATSVHDHTAASENCTAGGSEIGEVDHESVDCQVPDSDVYDFDKERQEESFAPGQVWALYDDDDGMPRFYAHIVEVVSVHPFHVRMNWLYPAKSVSKDVRAWVKAGFAYTCGEFRLHEELSRKSVHMFSHLMPYETGQNPSVLRIYPQKGDVWALYKIWKPRKGATRGCEPVEVISQYNEKLGVQVAPLFRVTGYRSIFCRTGTEGFWYIPKAELTRFSHQIPAHHFAGDEVVGLPQNCVDLDTAAINLD